MATNRRSTGTAPRTEQIDLNKYMQERSNSLNGITAGYGDIFTNYGNGLINNGSFQAIENARQNMLASTNRQYNDAAKNYYTQYRSNQAKLPETLSRLGVTGGGSETAQLGLMNNYSTNLYNNESARRNAINNANMQYDQQIAENSKAIAQQLADVYLQLALQAQAEKAAASSGGGGYGYSDGDYYGGDYYGDESGDGGQAYNPAVVANIIGSGGSTAAQIASNAVNGYTPTSSWTNPNKVRYVPRDIVNDTANRYSNSHAYANVVTNRRRRSGSGEGYSRGRNTNASMYK